MALARLIRPALLHRTEKRVTGAQAHSDLPGLDEPQTDDAGRIVPGPRSRPRFGIQTVFIHKIAADRTEILSGCGQGRELFLQTGRGRLECVHVPHFFADVHQVHARAVAVVNRRHPARQQRGQKRAHQCDARRFGIGLGLGLEKLTDLGPGEPLKRVRAGARGGVLDTAQFLADLRALRRGRRVHPNGRGFAREHPAQVLHQRPLGVQQLQRGTNPVIEIDRAVLLAAAADGQDIAQRHPVLFHARENQVQRLGPHQGRAMLHQRIPQGQHPVFRPVVRQRPVKVDRFFIDRPARAEIDDHRAEALRAGIQSEK